MAETAPHHRFAVMTASLVAANVLLFLLTLFLSHALRPDNEVLALGWKNNASVVAGQIWRLVTCCLLHAGWTHLILNMALLWYVGSVLEDTLGPWPPLVIYWVSGVAGAALSCRLGHYTSVGASGAVLGLVGAGIVLSRGQALPAEDRAELGRPMIFWLAATLVVGWLQPHIDQWAHLGGTPIVQVTE